MANMRRMLRAALVGTAIATTGGAAHAAEPWTPVPGETPTSGHEITTIASDSYCKYLHGIASSDKALQMWPTLFGTAGLVSPTDITGQTTTGAPAWRVTAGAQYSVTGLYRGFALEGRADAECATYRRFQELLAFIARNKEGMDERALRAKAKVYDDAWPTAAAKVEAARAHARTGKVTLEEVVNLEARLETVRAASAQAKRDAAQIGLTAASEDRPLRELLAKYTETERQAEEAQAAVRKSYGWDVSVKGGYDHVLGVDQKVPAFAVATVSVNLGLLFQGSGNDAAIESRPVASRWSIEGGGHPAVDAVRKLRELGFAESARLESLTQAITALEAREKIVRGIENDKAQLFADYLYFDLLLARAEEAYLRLHVAHIAQLTEERPPGKR